jgi:glycosyltransferase involved in cell wall biosynthesis
MTELIRRLDRTRFDVHVACFHRAGAWLSRVEACAPVTEFPIAGFSRPATLARAAGFARWCRSHRIAVVHSCDFDANTFALPVAAVAGVPLRVGSRRELASDKTSAQIALQRHACRCAHVIVANSSAAADSLLREGVPDARIRVIPNGVNLERFAFPRSVRPVRTILTVANLRREKAHEVLFGAIARVAPRHPALRLRLAGDGPRAAELRALAASLGVADRITFLGHRDDVSALLEDADAFVLPSRSEAFPNSVMEAMASGLPVIASAVGGLLELVYSGRTGVLVPVDDRGALADAIDSLIADPERAHALGEAARAEIAHRYSFDRMVQSFEEFYVSHLRAASQAA